MKKQFPLFAALALFLAFALTSCAQPEPKNDTAVPGLKYGKYNCTASKYVNGSYEYIARGSFTIQKNGTYTYNGFEKPSTGKFEVDKDGNLLFTGGYFDKGKAEKIDRPNKFFVVFPTIPDNRWTCSCEEN